MKKTTIVQIFMPRIRYSQYAGFDVKKTQMNVTNAILVYLMFLMTFSIQKIWVISLDQENIAGYDFLVALRGGQSYPKIAKFARVTLATPSNSSETQKPCIKQQSHKNPVVQEVKKVKTMFWTPVLTPVRPTLCNAQFHVVLPILLSRTINFYEI